jgi:hypothetical protein
MVGVSALASPLLSLLVTVTARLRQTRSRCDVSDHLLKPCTVRLLSKLTHNEYREWKGISEYEDARMNLTNVGWKC